MYFFIKKQYKKLNVSDNTRKFLHRVVRPAFLYFLQNTTEPISKYHGFDRGIPIDRFYIEEFLKTNKQHIRGRCLEVLNNDYTIKYGGDKVMESDILDIDATNKDATIIDDLRNLQKISDCSYDCIILTHVLQFIDDVPVAISECHRVLKNGGVLLVALPTMSRLDHTAGVDYDFWRFTAAGAKYLFEKKFNPTQIAVSSYGNVRSGICYYVGMAQEDISLKMLEKNDPNFPFIITVNAIK